MRSKRTRQATGVQRQLWIESNPDYHTASILYASPVQLLKQQAGAYGSGVEYAYTMVHHAPQSAQKPQVVQKKVASDGHAAARGKTPVGAR